MIKKITKRNLERRILDFDDYSEAAKYLKTENRAKYNEILDYYVAEGEELKACIFDCQKFDECCNRCPNHAVDRFNRKENDYILGEVDDLDDLLEAVAYQAGWEISKEARALWLRKMPPDKYYRMVSNSDLRLILENFLNGGNTTEFGTVMPV